MVAAVDRLGGMCSWRALRRTVPWRLIAPAVEAGFIVRTGPGSYALPTADAGRVVAAAMAGVVSHRTAALHWGWKVKLSPERPDVTVPSNRKIRTSVDGLSTPHKRTLRAEDVHGGWVTTSMRTVLDCCIDLPFDEALAVLDSALRAGVRRSHVIAAAESLGRRHRAKALAVVRVASPRAVNPFESVLRAIALQVPGAVWEPQHRICYDDFYARVDLACVGLRIVLEADSFEFHGRRSALDRDCERYNELVARGWLVLRFSWEQVMLRPEWVAGVIARAVQLRRASGMDADAGQGKMTDAAKSTAVA